MSTWVLIPLAHYNRGIFSVPQALENLTSATVRQKALIIPICCIVYMCLPRTGPVTPKAERRPGPCPPFPTVLCKKKEKKGYKGKRKSFKAETIKRLSSRSNCSCFIAILELLEFKIFSYTVGQTCWPTKLFSVPWSLYFEINFAGPE